MQAETSGIVEQIIDLLRENPQAIPYAAAGAAFAYVVWKLEQREERRSGSDDLLAALILAQKMTLPEMEQKRKSSDGDIQALLDRLERLESLLVDQMIDEDGA